MMRHFFKISFFAPLLGLAFAAYADAPNSQVVPSPFNSEAGAHPPPSAEAAPNVPKKTSVNSVRITWFGQACFFVEDKTGHKLLTDPFDKTVGYPIPSVQPTIITVSHEHPDHNAAELFEGYPVIIRKTGETSAAGIPFHGVSAWHDDVQGKRRGNDTIFIWRMGDLNFAHLGDLGQTALRPDQLTALRGVDVLFIPVGGTFTIDAGHAHNIISAVRPKVVIPMHYKTPAVELPLEPVDAFLKGPLPVKMVGHSIELEKKDLPTKPTIYVMDYREAAPAK